jgi:alkylation response protein AidB-like acyl-CoA dehydrogenase
MRQLSLRGKLGIGASHTTEIGFKDVRAPAANLVSSKEENSFRQISHQFNISRVNVSACALVTARSALEYGIRFAKQKYVFGAPLAKSQVTQFKLAEMSTYISATRNLSYETAWGIDNGNVDPSLIAKSK